MTSLTLDIDLQNALEGAAKSTFEKMHLDMNTIFSMALQEQCKQSIDKTFEITLRLVEAEESQQLNSEYRNKNKPTNVLSFPSDIPDFIADQEAQLYLGDLVICASVLQSEATEQSKQLVDHWTHICIHGLLHLLGYDHIDEADADEMESLETHILAKLGIDDPYQDHTH